MRLVKFLSGSGIASRRKSEEIIKKGLVFVNDEVVELPQENISTDDIVKVFGKIIKPPEEYKYILLNKPSGYITTMRDPHRRPTVEVFLKGERDRVYPVGRLDKDVSGVLFFTNDGELAHRLTHPSYQVPKTYRVKVKGIISEKSIQKMQRGIKLEEGTTAPAKVTSIRTNKETNTSIFNLTLHQGWKRQVKRMCREVGHAVLSLERISFASLRTDGLSPGSYRYLTKAEVDQLKKI